jgi:hypothetical protein
MGGRPVKDPATLYLHLPFDGEEPDSQCVWAVSLADVIRYEHWAGGDNHPDDPYETTEGAMALAKRLRELADHLEHGPPNWKQMIKEGP